MNKPDVPADAYVEGAEIDRDRDLTSALIYAATDLACSEPATGFDDDDFQALRKQARGFLKDWLTRKKPNLEMPKGL